MEGSGAKGRRSSGVATCVMLCVAVCGCTVPPVRHSPPARLDSPMAYDARRADAMGLTPTALLSSGPSTVGDLAQALTPAEVDRPPWEETRASPEDDYRAELTERYAEEIEDRWDELGEGSTYLRPVDDARLRLVWIDDPVKTYNEQGREFNGGLNFYASNRAVARVGNRLVLTASPEFGYVENHTNPTDSEDIVFRPQEAQASVRFLGGEISVGRQPLWWGPGRHGSLLLTNNARPLDMIRVSTGGPALLPGFLSYLGLLKFDVFASRLEESREVRRPYLAGARLSSRVCPYLELGATRTAMFGGGDRSVTWSTIWDVITARTENEEDNPGNQLASLDARVVIPWSRQPFEIYAEYGGEDEAGGFFSDVALLLGIYLPRIGPWTWIEWTLEVANNDISGDGASWYVSRNYPDGYTYHENVIGHHMGTDALDIFTEIRVRPVDHVTTYISYDFEEHFLNRDVQERLHQVRLGGEIRLKRNLGLSAFIGVDRWNNYEEVRGRSRTGFITGVGAQWSF